MCTRTFYKTGQALFAVERRCGSIIVYDCGEQKGVDVIDAITQSRDLKGKEILAVFISHYDDDHVNGLQKLFKQCSVKYLFLPLVEYDGADSAKVTDAALSVLSNYTEDSIACRLAFDTEETVKELVGDGESKNVKVIKVRLAGDNNEGPERTNEQPEPVVISDEDNNLPKTINSSDNIIFRSNHCRCNCCCWRYIPCNVAGVVCEIGSEPWKLFVQKIDTTFDASTELKQLYDYIKENGINNENNRINDLKEAAIEAKLITRGNINSLSMTLYSGPIECQRQGNNECHFCCDLCLFGKLGCLYTGDYNAYSGPKMAKLRNAYNKVWNKVGVIQIPHHGSRHNFNEDLIIDEAVHVIPNWTNPNPKPKDVDFNEVEAKIKAKKQIVIVNNLDVVVNLPRHSDDFRIVIR